MQVIEGNSTLTYARCECGKVSSASTCTTNEWRLSCVDPEYTDATSSTSLGWSAGMDSVLVVTGLVVMSIV